MTAARDFLLPVNEHRIAARVYREQLHDQIIAVHGWLDNLASFEAMAERMPHRRLYTVDLPGHGHSSHRPAGSAYHYADGVLDLYDIITVLPLQPVHIIGHSMGAGLGLMLASAAPNLVSSLVLIEGFGPLSALPSDLPDRLQTHLRQRRRLMSKTFPVYKSIDDALTARLSATLMSEAAARSIVERNLQKQDDGWTWRTDARLRIRSGQPFVEEQVLALIRGVKCPVLAIRAIPGLEFDTEQIEGRLAQFANLDYRTVSGNHHVHMDDAATVVQMIEDFYDKHNIARRVESPI